MKKILLSQGKYALVDDEDFLFLSRWKWCVSMMKAGPYAVRRKPGGGTLLMHRIVVGAQKGLDVDHRNGNTLDNRRSNLRLCTHAENIRNRTKKNSNNTSGIPGVYYHAPTKKWCARLKIDGKQLYLGLFFSKSKAAQVRKKAEIEHFGAYAPALQ